MENKRIVLLFAIFLVGIMLAACGSGEPPTAVPEEPSPVPESSPTEASPQEPLKMLLNVGPEKVPCEGEGPMECYQVRETPNGEWQLFYQEIEGFDWEPGFVYELQVNVYQVENPPAGGSSLRYELVEVVAKTPVPIEKTLYVGPERVSCEGEGPQQCYQVKETPNAEWQLFYNEIEGFEWDPGYLFELRVNVYQVENPPAGGSSLRYELVEVVSKTPVEVENVTGIDPDTVTIDTFNLPYSYQPNLVWETPYDNTQPPGPTGLPQHIQINFGVSGPSETRPTDPIYYIIPKAAYLEMWDAAGDPGVKNTLALLEILLDKEPDLIPTEGLPVLPNERVTGYNDLAVQGRFFSFDRGYGVRFVGRFSQDAGPISNEGLFYIFQGFNQDGNYFYSLFYPVKNIELADTMAEIPTEEMDAFKQDADAYKAEHLQALNGLAPADWEPSLETLDSMISSLNYVSVYDEPVATATPTPPTYDTNLVDISWQWSDFTDPNSQLIIADPENYVLVFLPDGALNIVADCNSGSGTYATNDSSMTIVVGGITRADCGEESLSDIFLRSLPDVASYVFDDSRLVLNLKVNAGNLVFQNTGTVVRPPDPEAGTPTATALEPINVRSGPGKEYESYGVVPIGTLAEIIGKSEDGKYWVVKLSTSIAPEGQGWVIATYVNAENADGVPVIPAP